MRALLVLVAVAVLVVVGLMQLGIVSFTQTRPAVVQAPEFQADVGRVDLGTENKVIAVPRVTVTKPGETPPAPATGPTDPNAPAAR